MDGKNGTFGNADVKQSCAYVCACSVMHLSSFGSEAAFQCGRRKFYPFSNLSGLALTGPNNFSNLSTLESVFKKLRFRCSKTSFQCRREAKSDKKVASCNMSGLVWI